MNYQDLVSVFYNRYSIVDNESVHHKNKERVMQRVTFCKKKFSRQRLSLVLHYMKPRINGKCEVLTS